MSKDRKNILPDAQQLGEEVVAWTMGDYARPRSDTGQQEQRVDVSVARLGHAIKAVVGAHLVAREEEAPKQTNALQDVIAERQRQIARWGNTNDTIKGSEMLAEQATHYLSAIKGAHPSTWAHKSRIVDRDPRRTQLVKGVALALAAIECMDREAAARLERTDELRRRTAKFTSKQQIVTAPTKRYVQVRDGAGKWFYTSLDAIERGDVFRVYDPTGHAHGIGAPVLGPEGEDSWVAKQDAAMSDGVWGVLAGGFYG